jgi:predicted HTH domain antitoxin
LGLPHSAALRSGLALLLFQAGSLSVGSAARIAGMSLPRFLEILASLRIPVADASDTDLDDELAQAHRWLGQGF